MALKLMYITNRPEVARVAEEAGVDRIFVDMEYIGKKKRQGGMDTVQSNHTIEDVKKVAETLEKAELLVRVNPIHEKTEKYASSKEEIDAAIASGADILMLPYFKTVDEVKTFVDLVDGRAKVIPLVETPEAVSFIDDILKLNIDEIYVGLNDLSLGYRKKFMFELLTDGTIEFLTEKFRNAKIPFGFGGIASLGKGLLPSEYVIREHYRLGSTRAILSRSFCHPGKKKDLSEIRNVFETEILKIRSLENECEKQCVNFVENKNEVIKRVSRICARG